MRRKSGQMRYLEQLIRQRLAAGEVQDELLIGRPEWEELGRPDIVLGVRIRPQPEPMTRWPGWEDERDEQCRETDPGYSRVR